MNLYLIFKADKTLFVKVVFTSKGEARTYLAKYFNTTEAELFRQGILAQKDGEAAYKIVEVFADA